MNPSTRAMVSLLILLAACRDDEEYAEALRRVELQGASVQDYAAAVGIQANNASVRLHRARAALHAQVARSCGTCALHGCIDCDCKHGACT